MTSKELAKARDSSIYVDNELLRARCKLGESEVKLLNYLYSRIKPEDDELLEWEFNVNDYCRVVGINKNENRNNSKVKQALWNLRSSVFWLDTNDGWERSVAWLAKADIEHGSGKVAVKFDPVLHPYLIGLKRRKEGNYTNYEYFWTLGLESKHSLRLYMILRSHAFKAQPVELDLQHLKEQLFVEKYKSYENFKEFRRRVLEPALKEISRVTDITVEWEVNPHSKERKRVVSLDFTIAMKSAWEQAKARHETNKALNSKGVDGQIHMAENDCFMEYPDGIKQLQSNIDKLSR